MAFLPSFLPSFPSCGTFFEDCWENCFPNGPFRGRFHHWWQFQLEICLFRSPQSRTQMCATTDICAQSWQNVKEGSTIIEECKFVFTRPWMHTQTLSSLDIGLKILQVARHLVFKRLLNRRSLLSLASPFPILDKLWLTCCGSLERL